MLDPVLLCALGLALGAGLALAPWPTALAIVAVASCLTWRRPSARPGAERRARLAFRAAVPWPTLCIALVMAALGAWRSQAALDEGSRRWLAAVQALPSPRRCVLRGVIARSPVVRRERRGAGDDEREGDARIDVDVAAGECAGQPLGPAVRARLYGAPEQLGRGDRVEVLADLAPVQLYWNPGTPDPRQRLALSGVTVSGGVVALRRRALGPHPWRWMDQARRFVRQRIEATFTPSLAPFARALVLGETDLESADREAFRLSGLAHLLAVSGTHLVIAVLAWVRLLRALLVRIEAVAARWDAGRMAAAAGAVGSWAYADFAGGGGSAYRAAAMLSCGLLARAAGGRPSPVRCFAWSLLAGAAVEPLAICDLSFALSVSATAGLLLAREPAAAILGQQGAVARWLLAPLLATAAAMVGCAPWLLLIAPELPLLGVLANVLAAPVGELAALPLCLLHAVLWWSPWAERGAAILASGALVVVRAIAHSASSAPGAVLRVPTPTAEQLGVLAAGAAICWRVQAPRARACLASAVPVALLLCELGARAAGAPAGTLRVSQLDVGQGDAALVDLPDRRAMLIDGGGARGSPVDLGQRVLLPVLRARRRSRVDVVVITHAHPDHYLGLQTALPRLEVGEVWVPGLAEPQRADSAFAELLASLRRRGVPVRHAPELCGQPRRFGQAVVQVLGPCPAPDPQAGANDNSLVVHIAYGRRAALLVGDAEAVQERRLLAHRPAELGADLLKLGHHGSRSSTTHRWLAQVAPRWAVASAGVRNRFGHPHRETLCKLRRHGVVGLRTDRGGAVIWSTDGQRVRVERPAAEPWSTRASATDCPCPACGD